MPWTYQERDNIPEAGGKLLVGCVEPVTKHVNSPATHCTIFVTIVDHITDKPWHEHNPQWPRAQGQRQVGKVGLIAEENLKSKKEVPFEL